jgi:hypothetical protein
MTNLGRVWKTGNSERHKTVTNFRPTQQRADQHHDRYGLHRFRALREFGNSPPDGATFCSWLFLPCRGPTRRQWVVRARLLAAGRVPPTAMDTLDELLLAVPRAVPLTFDSRSSGAVNRS